jgi:peptidoglycan hydrolase CwlO-like protein
MISLEQIRLLEARIIKAVELIRSLKDENKTLRRAVNAAQTRMRELEKLVGDFKSDQQEIEQCILRALENLDRLEEEVTEKKGRKEPAPARGEAARERARGAEAPQEEPAPAAAGVAAAEEASSLPPGTAGGGPGEKELDIF